MSNTQDLSKTYKEKLQEVSKLSEESFDKIWCNDRYSFEKSAYSLWFNYERKAWISFLVENDLVKTKEYFNACGTIDCERIERFNVGLFAYGRNHVLYAALSDNIELIKRYSTLDYQNEYESRGKKIIDTFSERVTNGDDEIYCDTIIKSMSQDMDGLARNLKILENVTLKKKTREWMKPDYDFFKAILNQNIDEAFEAVERISSKRLHNARNNHDILYKNFVTQPGQGFAKIAWINNLQIEPTSEKIFKELLPIDPNPCYKDLVSPYFKQKVIITSERVNQEKNESQDLEVHSKEQQSSKPWWRFW